VRAGKSSTQLRRKQHRPVYHTCLGLRLLDQFVSALFYVNNVLTKKITILTHIIYANTEEWEM